LSCCCSVTSAPSGSARRVEQLSRPDGYRAGVGGSREAAPRRDLDLDVGREERERVGRAVDQHVGQDRQRMAPLDDSADRRQGGEDLVARRFDQNHVSVTSV
jgi:hypothetical protein